MPRKKKQEKTGNNRSSTTDNLNSSFGVSAMKSFISINQFDIWTIRKFARCSSGCWLMRLRFHGVRTALPSVFILFLGRYGHKSGLHVCARSIAKPQHTHERHESVQRRGESENHNKDHLKCVYFCVLHLNWIRLRKILLVCVCVVIYFFDHSRNRRSIDSASYRDLLHGQLLLF